MADQPVFVRSPSGFASGSLMATRRDRSRLCDMSQSRRRPRRTHMKMIEVQGLTKIYPGGVEAVRALDFEVAAGEVFGLLGPNGAGKSTTIGMLTTTITPTSGRALLAGHDVGRRPRDARQVSAVVFQDAVVDKMLSGRRNLDNHARLWGLDATTAAT